jgi:hypothetical protein
MTKIFDENCDYYQTILGVITNIQNAGLIGRGSGYCVSMSDMILKLLNKHGIECELIECSVMITLKDPPTLHLIGYSGLYEPKNNIDEMSNHVICITKTQVPILIDVSLSNIDTNVPYVCMPIIKKYNHCNIGEFDFGTSIWTYEQKFNSELPMLYQKSILQRIKTDLKTRSDIEILKKIIIAVAIISTINLIRGSYDFYQKYINQTNDFGPTKQLVKE